METGVHKRTIRPRLCLSLLREFFFEPTIVALTVLFLLAGAALTWQQWRVQSKNIESTLLEEAHAYSEALTTFRSLYTSEVVETVRSQGIRVTHDYDPQLGEIPLPATLSINLGNSIGEMGSEVQSRLYSPYPFPWREKEGGLRDDFSKSAWAALTRDPDTPFYRFETVNGRSTLRYATADVMRSSCIDCHNQHDDTPKDDWTAGDVRGVLEVMLPVDRSQSRAHSGVQQSIFLLVILGVAALSGLAIVIGRLRRNSANLERRVQERTAELTQTNQQLSSEISERTTVEEHRETLIDQLETKNAELEQFTYAVSHDLKSPLITISGFVGTLEGTADRGDLDTLKEDVGRIQKAAVHMQALLDEVLELSRIGRLANTVEDVDLKHVVEDVIALCAGQIEASQVAVDVADGLPLVRADPIRMRQVFQNLIGNAVAHMGVQPNPRINIGVRRDNEETVCYVADNGIGISPEYHEKVFDLFEKLRAESPGTGIGLALVKRIVVAHNARVWVESEGAGKGSTFCFTVNPIGVTQGVN
jgi:signal transduction histidine kinase